ncbi:MAG: hypothetical protein OEW06_11580, partial [Gemmatimonadota bacterium]|nr:hypothetical protein [Gemmatimonadota bacterium]
MRLHASVTAVLLTLAPSLSAQVSSSDYTAPYQQRALEIFRTSIGYRTAASHGQVPVLARYLADQFRAGGFPDEDVH